MTSMAGPTQWLPDPADPYPGPGSAERSRRWRLVPAVPLICALVLAPACSGTVNPYSPSSAPSPPITSDPTPSPSPTRSTARERAVAESRQAYVDFTRAVDQFAQAGGGTIVPDYLDSLMHPNGPVREYVLNEMSTVRQEKLRSAGFGVLRNLELLESSDLSASPPELHWSACLDQSKVEVTQAGKPYPGKPDFLAERAVLKFDRARTMWRIWDLDVRLMPAGRPCEGGKQ